MTTSEAKLELLSEEDRGLGIIVVAGTVLVSGAEIETDGDLEVVFGVKVKPLKPFAAGVLLNRLHQAVSQTHTPVSRPDIKALDLGSMWNLR